jgi:hypothetical protein
MFRGCASLTGALSFNISVVREKPDKNLTSGLIIRVSGQLWAYPDTRIGAGSLWLDMNNRLIVAGGALGGLDRFCDGNDLFQLAFIQQT